MKPKYLFRTALFLVASVLVGRFLTTENPRGWIGPLSAWAYTDPGPGPVTTLVFAGLLLLAFCLWLIGVAHSGRMSRWPGWLAITILSLSVCTIIASALAHERRIAAHLAASWITQWLAFLMLLDLLRVRSFRKTLLTAVLATAALVSVRCIYQSHVELPEMLAKYRQNPQEMLSGIGATPGTSRAIQFEERITQAQATGYFALGNVTASVLILTAMAALGLAMDRIFTIRRKLSRPLGLMLLAVAAAMVYAIFLTGSKGAMAGMGFAIILFVGYLTVKSIAHRRFPSLRMQPYYRTIALAIVVIVAIAVLAVVAVGLKYDSLGVKTLTFRWQYWVGSARMFAQSPWIGVGPGNFKFHYPAYKLAHAVEEVANPHNPIVQTFTEMGVFAGLSLIACLAGIFVVATRPSAQPFAPVAVSPGDKLRIHPLLWLMLLAIGGFGLRTAVNIEGSALLRLLSGATAPEDVPVLLLGLIAPLVVWIIAFLIVACDSDDLSGNDLPATPLLRIAVICGLGGFVLHNQITFSMLHGGGGTIFWAFAGLAVAMHPSKAEKEYHLSKLDRYLVLVLTLVAMVGFTRIILVPAATEQIHLGRAVRAYQGRWPTEVVELELTRAARVLPSDPRPHAVLGEVLAERGFIDRAVAQQRQAVQKNPPDWTNKLDLARLLAEQARRSDDRQYWDAAVKTMYQAIECYPTSPVLHEYLADLYGRQQDWANAAEHYEQALDFNEAKKIDPNYQWPEVQRRQVEAKLRIAQENLTQDPHP